MKAHRWCAAAVILLAGFPFPAWALDPQIDSDVTCSLDKHEEDVDKGTQGSGREETVSAQFSAKLANRGLDTLQHIRLKIYVIASQHTFTNGKVILKVHKVIEKKDVGLGPTEEKIIDLGHIEFKHSDTGKDNLLWRDGMDFQGWVAEFYIDDKLVSTSQQGGRDVRHVYEDYVKQNGAPTTGDNPSR
jgi:hypothetical protein